MTALPLVTKTPLDGFSEAERRKLAQMEACPPEPESWDGAAELRRVLALLDELAGRWHGTPKEAGVTEARDGVRELLGVRSE